MVGVNAASRSANQTSRFQLIRHTLPCTLLQNPLPVDGYAVIWAVELEELKKAMHRVYVSLKTVPRTQGGLLELPCRYVQVALHKPFGRVHYRIRLRRSSHS